MICFCKPPSLHQSVLQSRPDSNLRWRKLPVAGHRSHASLATFLWLTKEGLWLRPSARRWVPIRALSCRPQARALGGTGAIRLPDRTSAHTCAPIVAALVCLVCLRSHLRLAPPRPRPHPARRAHLRHDRVEATENRCAGPRLGTAHQGRDGFGVSLCRRIRPGTRPNTRRGQMAPQDPNPSRQQKRYIAQAQIAAHTRRLRIVFGIGARYRLLARPKHRLAPDAVRKTG